MELNRSLRRKEKKIATKYEEVRAEFCFHILNTEEVRYRDLYGFYLKYWANYCIEKKYAGKYLPLFKKEFEPITDWELRQGETWKRKFKQKSFYGTVKNSLKNVVAYFK